MTGDLRVGTSGWNYPSGRGTWNGVFYPPARRRPDGFDELRFYAEHFNTVEVNSTFYGQPRTEVSRSWVARTPPGFEFSVKLYQKFTHPKMFKEALQKRLAKGLDDGEVAEAAVAELARPNAADLDLFRRGIDPIASSGRLGALLAQFPPSFKDSPASREYLQHLLREFSGHRVAVELRHRSWSDDLGGTLALLNGFGAAFVQIDEPKFRLSIRQNYLPNVRGFYYMRLHGRNAAKWWAHDKSEDRYDYLYSEGELKEFSETAAAASEIVKKTYVYTNNHFSAKSVANAVMIKRQLGQPIDGDFPPSFVEKYPELAGVVNVAPPVIPDHV
jgi:uncharacterized protein YecE (DUF72 family)